MEPVPEPKNQHDVPGLDLSRATTAKCFSHLSCVTAERAIFFTNGSTCPVRVPAAELPTRIQAIQLAFFAQAMRPWEFSLTREQNRALTTELGLLEEAHKQVGALTRAAHAHQLRSV